jgi:phytoene dehydrogenase-like protein
VVAGAGHNSLVATAYLAKAGFQCLVLEARATVGGDTATEELTLPGFRHDSCSTAHNLIQASPTLLKDELGLAAHGLRYLHPDPVVHVPFPDGSSITQWRDLDRTCAELARFSPGDAAAFRRLLAEYDAVKHLFSQYRYTPAGWGPELGDLLADHPAGADWGGRLEMSAWDVIAENFEDEHTRTFLLWMAFLTMQPPQRPGTGPLAYSLPYGRQHHSWTMPEGGSGALPEALRRVIRAHGSEVRTGKRVVGLVLDGGRCTGVETADGQRYNARRGVLSTIHIKDLVGMAPAAAWDAGFRDGVAAWEPGVSMLVTHYAATEAPRFPVHGAGVTPVAAGIPTSVERMLRVGTEFHRGLVATDDPVLLVVCPTAADPTRAPAGRHTLKVIGFQPYALAKGPEAWDGIKGAVSILNLAQLRRYAPNVTEDAILATEIKSPLDLERFNAHNWHGSCHGGDMHPGQSGLRRPVPGWAEHRLPIPGLYQTGATTHPGGSVSAAPGRNAAMVMLRDLGTSLAAVVGAEAQARVG